MDDVTIYAAAKFLSTPSARRATNGAGLRFDLRGISIHALREEGDPRSARTGQAPANFYPRPPRGGRRHVAPSAPTKAIFLSTPSARRATCFRTFAIRPSLFLSTPSARRATRIYRPFRCRPAISIHALREEGDSRHYIFAKPHCISIHALREEGDRTSEIHGCSNQYFYPRPPRGGRPVGASLYPVVDDFYPRPPRGGRPVCSSMDGKSGLFLSTPSARRATQRMADFFRRISISIHALREEGDGLLIAPTRCLRNFYPRPPRGGRLGRPSVQAVVVAISIHALREEGDQSAGRTAGFRPDFYPRPPRGGRQFTLTPKTIYNKFLSTPSARRATYNATDRTLTCLFLSTPSARRATWTGSCRTRHTSISIHALREEGDKAKIMAASILEISIHALREEGDLLQSKAGQCRRISIHALREEGDSFTSYLPAGMVGFLSTPSARRATTGWLW